MTSTNLTHLDCRRAAHDAARHLRNLQEGNPFTIAALPRLIDKLTAAYMAPACEPQVARRLHALIDQITEYAD